MHHSELDSKVPPLLYLHRRLNRPRRLSLCISISALSLTKFVSGGAHKAPYINADSVMHAVVCRYCVQTHLLFGTGAVLDLVRYPWWEWPVGIAEATPTTRRGGSLFVAIGGDGEGVGRAGYAVGY